MDENPRQTPDVRRSSIIAHNLLPLFLCLRQWPWPQSDMPYASRMPLATRHAHGGAAGVWHGQDDGRRSSPGQQAVPSQCPRGLCRRRRALKRRSLDVGEWQGLENWPRGNMKPFRSPSGRRFSIAAFELDARPQETPLARQGRALGGAGSRGVSKPHQHLSRRARPRQWQRRNPAVGPRKGGRMAPSRFRFPWPRSGLLVGDAQRPSYEGQTEMASSRCNRAIPVASLRTAARGRDAVRSRAPCPPANPCPFATLQPRRRLCHGIPKMSNRHRHLDSWSAHHPSPPTTHSTQHQPPSPHLTTLHIPPSTSNQVHSATSPPPPVRRTTTPSWTPSTRHHCPLIPLPRRLVPPTL